MVRRVLVAALEPLLAPQAVCAAVAAVSPLHPPAVATFRAGHATVEIPCRLGQIDCLTRKRRDIRGSMFATVDNAAASRCWIFPMPASRSAQWIPGSGRSDEVAQQAEVTITALDFSLVGANA